MDGTYSAGLRVGMDGTYCAGLRLGMDGIQRSNKLLLKVYWD